MSASQQSLLGLPEGTDVFAADGWQFGTIHRSREDGLEVVRGIVWMEIRFIPKASVAAVGLRSVHLRPGVYPEETELVRTFITWPAWVRLLPFPGRIREA